MTPHSRNNFYFGLFFLAFAIFVAAVWVPLDTETGLIEKVRRQINIGDALAPTVAAFFIGLGGLMLLVFERNTPDQPGLTYTVLKFVGIQIAILVLGFVIMLYAGPIALSLFNGESEYRLLRDTAPWKYVGYFIGSVFIITSLISQAEGKFTLRSILIAIGVALALIAIYDLPFEDLLLPPNGDV